METIRKEKLYTFSDWLAWPEGERWEIIDGVAYMMAPPSIRHQGISVELCGQLREFLKDKACKVYPAIGVRLDSDGDTVFEPDISIVCDKSKLADGKVCNGAPDMIIEILSPSTAGVDKLEKFIKLTTLPKSTGAKTLIHVLNLSSEKRGVYYGNTKNYDKEFYSI